ncbi:MAG: polyprenyl synthetase family protein, partial [Eudoraea sp.]|nr:polyprenyl synthetase family protein [Eudoraea sp.]
LRPAMTLMTAALFDGDYKRAFPAAMAIEVFHNFSLVHDDIMDEAPLRRGKETVHKKWDLNTGILSGDAMLISSYTYLEHYGGNNFKSMVALFSQTAIEVCEGQQYDMDFEERDDVSLAEYLKMIEYKTAVLVAAAIKMGAMVAEAAPLEQQMLYEYGRNLGIAFQLQDDYLDAFGNPENFGKQIGGDIIENKKTFLYLKTKELCNREELKELNHLFSIKPADPATKIRIVKALFESSGAAEESKKAIECYTMKAFEHLEKLRLGGEKKAIFRAFGEQLINREF